MRTSNVVGYTARDVANDFQIVPVQFENVDGTTIDLLKYLDFPTPAPVSAYGDWSDGTQIWVQSPLGGYDTYLYANDAFDMTANEGAGDFVTGWCDSGFMLVNSIPVAHGCSVWLYNPNTATISLTTAGQVLNDDSKTVSYDGDFVLTCCPFPVKVAFKDVGLTEGITPVSAYGDWNDGTQIWVQSPFGGYDTYLYANDAFDMSANGGAGDFVTGWCDSGFMLVDEATVFADSAQGFWVYSPIGQTIKLTYTK